MNDRIRNLTPGHDDFYYTAKSGAKQILITKTEQLESPFAERSDAFFAWLSEQSLSLPLGYADEERIYLNYLQSYLWDNQDAYRLIQQHNKILTSDVMPMGQQYLEEKAKLNRGVVYAFGRDKMNRPIVIFNFKRMFDLGIDADSLAKDSDFFFNYLIFSGLEPGKIEQYILVYDFAGVPAWKIPYAALSKIVDFAAERYTGRVSAIYCVNLSWIVKQGGMFLTNTMDEFMKEKTVMLDSDETKDLGEMLGKDNTEEKFGGNHPNKVDDFFPPYLNL